LHLNHFSHIFMPTSTKKEVRPRGRPRAYDSDQALADARDVFWRSGYAGTSLDQLSAWSES
jgi:1,2-phenylacetyl-CoA epoxidase PaaB subunit